MSKKIICDACGTIFPFEKAKDFTVCPVCGADLTEEEHPAEAQKEKKKWYYYDLIGGVLTNTLYDDETPLYTFEAVDMEDAERQLKEVLPNSPLLRKTPSETTVKCPYCGCTDIKIVPKKFSLLTGFATNKLERVCAKCMRKF